MNRRGFFGRFAGMAAVPVALTMPVDGLDLTKSEFEYRGFIVRWTGWKCDTIRSNWVAGQYWAYLVKDNIAGRQSGPFFYASYPGGEGQFFQGEVFDISMHRNQKTLPLAALNQHDKRVDDELQRLTWLRLKRWLDGYSEGRLGLQGLQVRYRYPEET